MTLRYRVFQSEEDPNEWSAGAVDSKEGDIYIALFEGPDAEARAREYVTWKNGDIVEAV